MIQRNDVPAYVYYILSACIFFHAAHAIHLNVILHFSSIRFIYKVESKYDFNNIIL